MQIFPRQPFQLLGILPNWSPVVDFTTTDDFTEWHPGAQKDKTMVPWQQAKHRKPDRIFATCEGGSKGSITEYRYGLKANIALDLEYGAVMKQAWLLRLCDPPAFDGYLLLLSLPDSTAGLLLSSDFSNATAPAAGMVPYDLSSTTLALVASGQMMVQITGHSVVLATQQDRYGRPFVDKPTPSTNLVAAVRSHCRIFRDSWTHPSQTLALLTIALLSRHIATLNSSSTCSRLTRIASH